MKMSFTRLCLYKHLNIFREIGSELNTVQKVCGIHTTSCCRKESLIGLRPTPKVISKEKYISKAMQSYLVKKQMADAKLEQAIAEYDLGKKHLANIMGIADDEEMTDDDIKVAISYLFPSGLTNKKARPIFEHPLKLKPPKLMAEHDETGRPKHYLHYTAKPKYFEFMHVTANKLENIHNTPEGGSQTDAPETPIDRHGSEWLTYNEFTTMFYGENVGEHEYRRFIVLLDRLLTHPLGAKEKDYIFQYRNQIATSDEMFSKKEASVDETGRKFFREKGGRKTARAEVVLTEKGTGQWSINGQDITYFPDLLHRQSILSPLQICGVMDNFDVTAEVNSGGPSAQAGAIRLALAKALAQFSNEEMRERMRIAGLLTRDPRVKERKKPGQERARKKFIWKRR